MLYPFELRARFSFQHLARISEYRSAAFYRFYTYRLRRFQCCGFNALHSRSGNRIGQPNGQGLINALVGKD